MDTMVEGFGDEGDDDDDDEAVDDDDSGKSGKGRNRVHKSGYELETNGRTDSLKSPPQGMRS